MTNTAPEYLVWILLAAACTAINAWAWRDAYCDAIIVRRRGLNGMLRLAATAGTFREAKRTTSSALWLIAGIFIVWQPFDGIVARWLVIAALYASLVVNLLGAAVDRAIRRRMLTYDGRQRERDLERGGIDSDRRRR